MRTEHGRWQHSTARRSTTQHVRSLSTKSIDDLATPTVKVRIFSTIPQFFHTGTGFAALQTHVDPTHPQHHTKAATAAYVSHCHTCSLSWSSRAFIMTRAMGIWPAKAADRSSTRKLAGCTGTSACVCVKSGVCVCVRVRVRHGESGCDQVESGVQQVGDD